MQLPALLEKSHKGPEVAGPLEAMLNAIDVVQDCQGVRAVNELLEQFGLNDAGKVKPILEKLVGDPKMIDELINEESAHFAITVAVECSKPNTLCKTDFLAHLPRSLAAGHPLATDASSTPIFTPAHPTFPSTFPGWEARLGTAHNSV